MYYTGVLAVAALLAGSAWAHPPVAPVWVVVFAILMQGLFESRPVPLPGGAEVGAGLVASLPTLLLVGPFWASVASVTAIIVMQGIRGRRPLDRWMHAAALAVLVNYAAGSCYVLFGGAFGTVLFPEQWWPMLATGLVMFGVESFGVAVFVGFTQGPSAGRVWERGFGIRGLHHLSFLSLGMAAAVLAGTFGLAGFALVALPMALARVDFGQLHEFMLGLKQFVQAFIEPLERVDPYTRHHSVRVSVYSVRLARGLRRPEHEVAEIEQAALVHDIGKIGPEQQYILQKPGALTQEEQRTLEEHCRTGADIVSKLPWMRRVSEIVLAHHERPDGQGYPHGLRADDVPMGSRIIHVADAFDAMTSDRPYRRALPVDAALRELERWAGTQFDTEVVRVLLDLHATGAFPLVPSPTSDDLKFMRQRMRVGGM